MSDIWLKKWLSKPCDIDYLVKTANLNSCLSYSTLKKECFGSANIFGTDALSLLFLTTQNDLANSGYLCYKTEIARKKSPTASNHSLITVILFLGFEVSCATGPVCETCSSASLVLT